MRPKHLSKIAAGFVTAVVLVSLLESGHVFGSSPEGLKDSFGSSSAIRVSLASQKHQRGTGRSNGYFGWSHDVRVIEKWSLKFAPDSFAGLYFKSNATRLVVGFTESQAARVRAVKRLPGLIAPKRVSAFPYVPEHSLSELEDLLGRILSEVMTDDAHYGLIVGVGVDVEANRVDVGTEHIKRTRDLLRTQYGLDAPIFVHYEKPPARV